MRSRPIAHLARAVGVTPVCTTATAENTSAIHGSTGRRPRGEPVTEEGRPVDSASTAPPRAAHAEEASVRPPAYGRPPTPARRHPPPAHRGDGPPLVAGMRHGACPVAPDPLREAVGARSAEIAGQARPAAVTLDMLINVPSGGTPR
ncbi:hypothetical protein [Streptomyces sp. TRM68416]|uniref:hypothetical protein n=1 Tax=Streptomyces sp. TRM68416 TaxID=2758412 RepID=UPI0016619456|nr:hypothetical protein [Streptomyces sp. TRM68416]MBD0839663.1 hypothetical protein [Streptomyces sp. TRM68416]